ncbi:MAG: glycosyltransferase [Ardenticatenaceae bacterium]|nr:glycosyltransferase [Ardenticatenaceae bacterium]
MTLLPKPRILLYSHDTYGLGHLRRSLSIAHQIAQDIPGSHQLLLTGSMVAGAFALPPRLDLVKLPALSKRSSGEYKARTLPLTLKQTLAWREQIILQAAVNFRPHLVLVDKVAAGVHGELLPTLRHLRTWSPDTKIILGMRDIEDSPDVTRQEWEEKNTHTLLNDVYHRILFYGQRDVFDPITAYDMSLPAAAKLVECGYVRRTAVSRQPDAVRRELNIGDKPLILVTVGGGGDGYDIAQTYLDMFVDDTAVPYHSVIVTGPLMPRAKRKALRQAIQNRPVTLLEFTPDLTSYLKAADLVVSMAGYNTVCEILSLQKRALLIPRTRVREEQLIRAQALADRGLAHLLLPEELTPQRLATQIEAALAAPRPRVSLNMNALGNVSQTIAAMLQEEVPAFVPNGHGRQPVIF